MARRALWIIEEYLRALDVGTRIRRNAVTALAALEDREGVRRLVEIATADPDPAVAQHATEELVGLPADLAGNASELLRAALSDRKAEMRAYEVLGRLASVAPVRWPSGLRGLPRRSLSAWRFIFFLHPLYPWDRLGRSLMRAGRPALIGGCIAAIAFYALAVLTRCTSSSTLTTAYSLVAISALLSATGAIFVTARWRQPDPDGSALVEIAGSSLSTGALGGFFIVNSSYDVSGQWPAMSVLACCCVALTHSLTLIVEKAFSTNFVGRISVAVIVAALLFAVGYGAAELRVPTTDGVGGLFANAVACVAGYAYTQSVLSGAGSAAAKQYAGRGGGRRRLAFILVALVATLPIIRAAVYVLPRQERQKQGTYEKDVLPVLRDPGTGWRR